jgi:hypothetical protein
MWCLEVSEMFTKSFTMKIEVSCPSKKQAERYELRPEENDVYNIRLQNDISYFLS